MTTLFDVAEGAAAEPEDELFGSALPEGYVPLGRSPERVLGDVKALEEWAKAEPAQTAKKFNYRDHYKRAIKALNELHPGLYEKMDYELFIPTSFRNGRPDPLSMKRLTKDWLGFADVGGTSKPNGRMVCANITTKGQIAAHLRKYTDPKETHGSGKVPIETYLRQYLECGGLFYVLGYHKVGRFWKAEVTEVTLHLLDEYAGRKRRKA